MRQLPPDHRHRLVRARLNTDGGARGNPGPAGIGVVLRSEDGSLNVEIAKSLEPTTNNVAEYTALIEGLQAAVDNEVTHLDIYLDSTLVVSQIKGEWKIKNDALRHLAVKARALLGKIRTWTIQHVPREENAEADRLANEAMDAAEVSGPSVDSSAQASFLIDE